MEDPLAIPAEFGMGDSANRSNLNHISESANGRRHEYSCGFERDEGAPDANTGETLKKPFELSFNASLRVDSHSSRATCDGA